MMQVTTSWKQKGIAKDITKSIASERQKFAINRLCKQMFLEPIAKGNGVME
jgi:hypothetical protein